MFAREQISAKGRSLYLGAAVVILFFSILSAPHRVHHFFQQFPASADHHAVHVQNHEHADGGRHGHDSQRDRPPGQQSDCVVLSVAQKALVSVVQSFSIAVVERIVIRDHDQPIIAASSFNSSPFAQRAPPLL